MSSTLPATQAIVAFTTVAGVGITYGSWRFGRDLQGQHVPKPDIVLGILVAALGGYAGAWLMSRHAVRTTGGG